MQTVPQNRRRFWWFAGGIAAGLAGYMALRYPVETATTMANGFLRARGATFHEVPWPGGTVRYVMVGSGTEPLVLVHGIGDSPESFGMFASGLLREYRICMPILPGHPGSPAPPELQLGDMVQALDSVILREFGARRVHLCGNSLGGWVSALFAADASERLASLMLVNPAGLHDHFDPDLLRPQTVADGERALRSIFGRRAAWLPQVSKSSFARALRARSEPAVMRMMAEAPSLEQALKSIEARTVVVIGESDRHVPPEQSLRAAELIGHASVELIRNGSHLPHLTDIGELRRIVRRHTLPLALLEA